MSQELMSYILIPVFSSIVCPVLCAGILWYGKRSWNSKEREDEKAAALEEGVRALLRNRILQGSRYYQQKGFNTNNSRIDITLMHEAYIKLGGNSIETHEYETFMELPHKREGYDNE